MAEPARPEGWEGHCHDVRVDGEVSTGVALGDLRNGRILANVDLAITQEEMQEFIKSFEDPSHFCGKRVSVAGEGFVFLRAGDDFLVCQLEKRGCYVQKSNKVVVAATANEPLFNALGVVVNRKVMDFTEAGY